MLATFMEERAIMETSVRPLVRPFAEVLSFQHDRLLARYASDNGVSSDVAAQRFEGFKQFMVVCAMKPGPKVTSDAIDSVWHSFLLFTSDYRAFCTDYLGRFINHEPFEHPNPLAYHHTRSFAEGLFGALDERLWPLEAKGDCSSGCGD